MRRKPLFPPPHSETTGLRLRHKGRQKTTYLTVNGRIRLQRLRWHEPSQGSLAPLDDFLDQARLALTRGVLEMLCRLNQCSSSFAKTAENLKHLTSISISAESARQAIESEGKVVAETMRQGRLKAGWTADDCVTESGATRVYLGCDGVQVPVVTDTEKRKRRQTIKDRRRRSGKRRRPLPPLKPGADQAYKEARIVVAYDEDHTRRMVLVTADDCTAAGRLIRSAAVDLKLDRAAETIAIIDGAPWIRNQFELHGAVQRIGLDYYHLKDNAEKARREVFGEGTEEGRAWLDGLKSALLDEGFAAAWSLLTTWRQGLRGRKRAAADRLLHYVSERREILCYREFRRRGWQIGSGPTEAQCKTTTQRVKGRGRRWDLRHAESLMALAALEAGSLWDRWWSTPTLAAA